MPAGTDLHHYAEQLIARFANPSLKHRTWQIAMDGSQKLPQRLLDSIRAHIANGTDYRHLTLGVAGWMRYVSGVDEHGQPIEVIDPLLARYQQIHQQYDQPVQRVYALLGIDAIFGRDLLACQPFVDQLATVYQRLCQVGARAAVEAL